MEEELFRSRMGRSGIDEEEKERIGKGEHDQSGLSHIRSLTHTQEA